MEIIVAKSAGFCFGVKRAVNLTETSLTNGKSVYSVGSIVHNKYVNDELTKKGLIFVDSLDEVPNGSDVIIRAHGVTSSEIEKCREKELKIIDTTCPNVKKIHNVVNEYSNKGYTIIIIGDENHPEVVGISGWVLSEFKVINKPEQVKDCDLSKVCVVSQTTMNIELNKNITDLISENAKECVIFNTICMATENRQKELKLLSKDADFAIVIGDKSSANSNRLYDIAKNLCKSQFIENIDELDLNFLGKSCRIIVMAGASTPQWLIDEVVDKLKQKE